MNEEQAAQTEVIVAAEGGERIDRFLAQQRPDLSRAPTCKS